MMNIDANENALNMYQRLSTAIFRRFSAVPAISKNLKPTTYNLQKSILMKII